MTNNANQMVPPVGSRKSFEPQFRSRIWVRWCVRLPMLYGPPSQASGPLVSNPSGETLSITPAHPLPAFERSLIWDSQVLPADKDIWGAFSVADLNHDQRADFVQIEGPYPGPPDHNAELAVYLQNTDKTFSKKASYPLGTSINWVILAADVNEDGNVDLLIDDNGTDMMLLLGKGDGTFQEPKYLGLSVFLVPVLADLNGDKHLDLVAGASDGSVMLFLGHGDGTFAPGQSLPTSIATGATVGAGQIMIGDVNRDNKPDIVVASPQQGDPAWVGNLDVFLGNGNGTFQDPISTSDVAGWRGALGDFNGDGIPDYAGERYSKQMEIWLGRADGHFARRATYALPYPPIFVFATDLNRDGILDLVVSGEINPLPQVWAAPLAILLGKGDGTFQAAQSFSPLPGEYGVNNSLQVVDFNGDGLPDLVTGIIKPTSTRSTGMAVAINPGFKRDPQSGFLVNVHGAASPVTLQMSTDLLNWTPIATNASPTAAWPVVDSAAGKSQRYYRTRHP